LESGPVPRSRGALPHHPYSTYFLKAALNEVRKHNGLPELDAVDFLTHVKDKIRLLELSLATLGKLISPGLTNFQQTFSK